MKQIRDMPKSLSGKIEKHVDKTKKSLYTFLINKIIFSPKLVRGIFLKKFKKQFYFDLVEMEENLPKKVQEKKYQFMVALLYSSLRNLDKGYISKKVVKRIINTRLKYSFIDKEIVKDLKEKFKTKYGVYHPNFIVLSPTQKCNLNCVGCYASSKINAPALPFKLVDKICNEVYNKWGNRFMTISGGEPLMYKSGGKTLFDIWKKYKEMFFLVYTNGLLIDKKIAGKFAKLGNVTPAISIEGFEKETDKRRGKGVFKRILQTMENLKEAGVPFGVSVTATSENIDVLLDDKFYDFIFQELGASYMWQFQLMPIGQAKNMKKLMINPEQRVKLYRKWEYLLKEKRYCIADFWNSGVLSNGCIAYGRYKGYLYIDWNGNIMPCVFVPYYEDNIIKLYKKGKTLTDALFSDFFVRGRKWQKEYGLNNLKKPCNWLMPCSIRDHWVNFRKNILTKKCKPEDIYAKASLKSKDYNEMLRKFDKELKLKTGPIWRKEYLSEK